MAKKSQAEEAFTQATDTSSEVEVSGAPIIYEVGFHLVPTIAEDGVGAAVEGVRKIIGDDAEFISEGFPQKISLAYVVERATQGKREKYGEAWFGWVKFATTREKLPVIERALLDSRDVLRSLIIETVREDIMPPKARAVFASDRLEGETIKKPEAPEEKVAEVSEAELDKSIDALTKSSSSAI
jgi:ribosomal protein S6